MEKSVNSTKIFSQKHIFYSGWRDKPVSLWAPFPEWEVNLKVENKKIVLVPKQQFIALFQMLIFE